MAQGMVGAIKKAVKMDVKKDIPKSKVKELKKDIKKDVKSLIVEKKGEKSPQGKIADKMKKVSVKEYC